MLVSCVRMRSLILVVSPACLSNPTSTPSSAITSSAVSTWRRVCGLVLAASAMMQVSLDRGARLRALRFYSPGQAYDVAAGSGGGDRQGSDGVDVGSTIAGTGPYLARLSTTTRSFLIGSWDRSCLTADRLRCPTQRRDVRLARVAVAILGVVCVPSSPILPSIPGSHVCEETYHQIRWPCPHQWSIDATRFGDTTSRII